MKSSHACLVVCITMITTVGCRTTDSGPSSALRDLTSPRPDEPVAMEWVKCAVSDYAMNPWFQFRIIRKPTGNYRILASKYEIPGPRLLGEADQPAAGLQDLALTKSDTTLTLSSVQDPTDFVFLRPDDSNGNGQAQFSGFIQTGSDGLLGEYADQQLPIACQESNVPLPAEDLFTGDVKLIERERLIAGTYGPGCDVHTVLLLRVIDGKYLAQLENRLSASQQPTCYPVIDPDSRQYEVHATATENGSVTYRGKDARGTIRIVDHRHRTTTDRIPMKVDVVELRDDPSTGTERTIEYVSSDAL